ncbi:MAG: autoinducer binding domain-containing protein [Maricaulaceae bacterium]
MFDIHECLARIAAATHYDALWENAVDCFTHCDVDLVSYYHISPPHAADAGTIDTLLHGYPKAWVELCLTEKLDACDPLIGASYSHVKPLRWSEIFKNPRLDLFQKNFVTQLTLWMKGDGYSFPLFGPSGRHGYIGLGNSASIQNWTPQNIDRLSIIAQTLHVRYSTLRIQELPTKFTLEETEQNIIKEIARGQTISAIAKQMGVEPEKFITALDMLMIKMGVGDVPSLIIRSESLGLIKSGMK